MDPVTTTTGRLRGLELAQGVVSFRGIPYAAPPVDELRWRPPEPPRPWTGVRDATTFGADPVQVAGIRRTRAPGMSEDCLFINVWAPAERRESGWPVIVWSGGGAFSTGGGAFVEEDPARLAARGAVVVTFNYRLGIFGFLAHTDLSAESPAKSSGNYGLMDCLAALAWVRENIRSFGGNDRCVTYMAESSGAAAGLLLLTTPVQRDVFDRAILLSPGSVAPLLPLADAEASGAPLGRTAEQLRAVPAEDLLGRTKELSAAPSNLSVARPLRPIIDGWLITDDRPLASPEVDHPPVILGTNEDEGRFFTQRMSITSPADLDRYLVDTFGSDVPAAIELYRVGADSDVSAAAAEVYGDVSINHPAERLLRAFAAHQANTFRFVYTYRHEGSTRPPTHSEEAATFLDSRTPVGGRDSEMAEVAARYVLNFAEHGDPNGAGLQPWPTFTSGKGRYLRLDLPPAVGEGWRAEQMEFLAGVHPDAADGAR